MGILYYGMIFVKGIYRAYLIGLMAVDFCMSVFKADRFESLDWSKVLNASLHLHHFKASLFGVKPFILKFHILKRNLRHPLLNTYNFLYSSVTIKNLLNIQLAR